MSLTLLSEGNISLSPWEESDWPIAFIWLDASWDMLSDDFHPRDIDSFVEIKRRQNAVTIGVYKDDELGGFLTQSPISPVLCQGHAVFKRRFWRPDETVVALELGKRLAWQMGYHKISAHVYPENKAMVRLLERVGGVYEGRLYSETQRGGKLVDMLSYALLREGRWGSY